MRGHDFETHRCEGSLRSYCSIRRYPATNDYQRTFNFRDGEWHLYEQEWDSEWGVTYMSHAAAINHCPWCGEELP